MRSYIESYGVIGRIVVLENVVALQRAEMRMVRWICGVKLKDRLPSKELRERLGVDDSIGIAAE